ncbi:MAG: tetratricopeptide repeat protein [Phycisphaerae bacterium]
MNTSNITRSTRWNALRTSTHSTIARSIATPYVHAALALTLIAIPGCNVDGFFASDRDVQQAPVAKDEDQRVNVKTVATPNVEQEEVDLVEAVVTNRRQYKRALYQLRDFYERRGRTTKQSWAEFEIKGMRNVKPFRYLIDAEVPNASLNPVSSIEQADRLYERGLELMKKGGHGVPALYREDRMVQASEVLRELVVRFPDSDKIDDAAFLLGEIHKEYLPDQETIALKWYEKAWTWDPNTPHPARFQAAVVNDYRLHDRDRALELYQAVIDHETQIESNTRFAMRRIYELSEEPGTRAPIVGRSGRK